MRNGVIARRRVWAAAALAVAGVSLLALAGPVSAETIKVSNTAEPELAVAKINAKAAANTIIMAPGTYQPSKALDLTQTAGLQTIEGSASLPTTLSGSSLEPSEQEILTNKPKVAGEKVSVLIKNLTETGAGSGGISAIVDLSNLEVKSSLVVGNTGPGIHVEPGATATITNSTSSDGLDFGLISSGTTTLVNSTVANNKNGGVENKNVLNLTNTIVANNSGAGDCQGKATTS